MIDELAFLIPGHILKFQFSELASFGALEVAGKLFTQCAAKEQITDYAGLIAVRREVKISVVAERLGWLGAELDPAANAAGATLISAPSSKVALHVLPTDEELMIARHTLALIGRS